MEVSSSIPGVWASNFLLFVNEGWCVGCGLRFGHDVDRHEGRALCSGPQFRSLRFLWSYQGKQQQKEKEATASTTVALLAGWEGKGPGLHTVKKRRQAVAH